MSITIGWWGVPALFTIISFGALIIAGIRTPPASGYGAIGDGLIAFILVGAATIVSLISWLVWALLR